MLPHKLPHLLPSLLLLSCLSLPVHATEEITPDLSTQLAPEVTPEALLDTSPEVDSTPAPDLEADTSLDLPPAPAPDITPDPAPDTLTESSPEDFQMEGSKIIKYIGEGGVVVIPSVINGTTVKSIEELAFHQAPITHLTIPGTITTIGGWAVYDCYQLETLTILEGVTKIEEVAFYYCQSLTKISFPDSLLRIEDEAFAYCLSLEEVTLPPHLTHLEYGAFHACSSLKEIVIPNTVTTLGEWVFYNCSRLQSVTLPTSIKKIPKGAFAKCTSLYQLTVPSNITSIDDMAFLGCAQLRQLFLPSTLSTFGSHVFSLSESIIYPEESQDIIPLVIWSTENQKVEAYAQKNNLIYLEAPLSRGTSSYEDVKDTDWYLQGVTFASNYHLLEGEDNLFSPSAPATRGMTAQAFATLSAEDLPEAFPEFENATFDDVTQDLSSFVAWCLTSGIMSGYDDGQFGQDDPLTREQFAAILTSFAKYIHLYPDTAPITQESYLEETFSDVEDISSYALEPMAWAVSQGLLVGSDGYLLPQNPVTRAEIATVLLKFFGLTQTFQSSKTLELL